MIVIIDKDYAQTNHGLVEYIYREGPNMDVNPEWTNEIITELDKTIERGNVDETTLKLMKELLKGAKVRVSISEYFKQD